MAPDKQQSETIVGVLNDNIETKHVEDSLR